MQRYSKAFTQAATRLAHAASRTMQGYAVDALPDEPTITGALVTRLHDALDDFATSGIFWSAKVLTSHGKNAEETEFGADFLGVLSLDLPGLKIQKGFLAQAKRQESGSKLSASDWKRLSDQCRKMVKFTPESFVFIYSLNGVFMIPAVKVLACTSEEDLHTLRPLNTGNFYRQHFECFIGDLNIESATPFELQGLRYRAGLEVRAKTERTHIK